MAGWLSNFNRRSFTGITAFSVIGKSLQSLRVLNLRYQRYFIALEWYMCPIESIWWMPTKKVRYIVKLYSTYYILYGRLGYIMRCVHIDYYYFISIGGRFYGGGFFCCQFSDQGLESSFYIFDGLWIIFLEGLLYCFFEALAFGTLANLSELYFSFFSTYVYFT